MLAEDEASLRGAFFTQSSMHDSLSKTVAGGWFLGFWPALYTISKKVQPAGCLAFTFAWGYAYYKGVNPFMTGRLQSGLNAHASQFAAKYDIKGDEEYLK